MRKVFSAIIVLSVLFFSGCSVADCEFKVCPFSAKTEILYMDAVYKGILNFSDKDNITFHFTYPEELCGYVIGTEGGKEKISFQNTVFDLPTSEKYNLFGGLFIFLSDLNGVTLRDKDVEINGFTCHVSHKENRIEEISNENIRCNFLYS